jgi:DNA-binding transcriptional ArsR family regulator
VTCTLCPKPRLARGWCNAHYKRWKKTGDPLGSVPRPRPKVCVNGHPYDQANTYYRADGKRSCKACARYFTRQYHRKARAAGHKFSQASKEWKAQYQREVRAGLRVPKPRQKPKMPVTATIVDFLTVDRGWWTISALVHRLDLKPDSVGAALRRLRERGMVEMRERSYQEWKAVPQEV